MKEVDELASPILVNGILYDTGPYAWEMRDLSKRGFELRQAARKKRVVHGAWQIYLRVHCHRA